MTENETEKTYTNDEVLKAISRLGDEQQQIIISSFSVDNIKMVCSNKANLNACKEALIEKANISIKIADAITELYNNLNNPSVASCADIMGDYDKLNEEKKKELALGLLNNGTFQRDCCEILIADMERIITENPTLKNLDNIFNLTGFYQKCLRDGIGLNHTYIVGAKNEEKHI
jgi:hypothetical protein